MEHVAELMAALARLEAKVDLLTMAVAGIAATTPIANKPKEWGGQADLFFRQFTPKQNAVLQMVVRGAENGEIAERLGVSVNTAKVHVRVIAKKLGVHSRVQIAMKASEPFRVIGKEEYMVASGGLPKDWDESYAEPDQWAHVYRSGENEGE